MTTLAVLHPIDPGTGARVTVRVCSSQERDATGAGGERWIPAMVVQPALTMALFDGDFTSAVSPAQSRIVLRLEALKEVGRFDRVARFDWSGAAVTLYRLEGSLPVLLAEMRVRSFGSEAGALSLDLSVDSEWADAEVLFRRYAGTTGAEGIADLKDRLKPWAFGRCRNVEPVQIDLIDNVFQVSGYGPVSAISAVYERGASFGASLGDFPNYAALVAADIPEGRWGTCLAEGMFRLGAPPAGVITCDVDGDSTSGFLRRTGAIISEIARRLGLETRVNAASLAALDVAVPRNVNILITEQTTLIDLAQAMAAPCNAVAALALDSRLVMPRIAFGAAEFVLDAQGRQMPPVLGMARQNSSPPYSEIRMGAARSWRVHTFDEIAFFADLIDRGLYDAATTYREGNIVESADKSRWVYVNPAASSGNAPPTWPTASNSFWSNIAPPLGGDLIGSIVAPANANRVPFSRMEGGRGWAVTANPSGLTVAPFYGSFPAFPYFAAFATVTASGQEVLIGQAPAGSPRFRVTPGERLSVQMRISANGPLAQWITTISWVRADGSITRETLLSGTAAVDTGQGFGQSFTTVPTGGSPVVGAYLDLYARSNGAGLLGMAIAEPMVTSAAAGQTVHPPFSPGPNARDGADPNSDILISGGVISGIGTANIFVDNARAVLQGLASARPAAGEYLNQVHFATDTLVASQWDGFNWRSSADITFAVSGPAEVKLSYRSDLTLISTLPVTATYQLAPAGASALTSGVTWAVSVVSGTFSGTAPSIIGSGSGQLRINSELTSAEAQLRVTATVAGRNYPPFNVTVRREIAAPTSTPLTSFSTSSFTQAHAATIQVAIPSGVTSATLSAVAELQIAGAAPSGVTTCEGKWQRESSPGTWVDIGAVATSSPSPEVVETEFTPGEIVYVPSSGSITCSRTATGLTGGTTQNFRFVARVSAGNVRNVQMIGNASAQA
jgi:hypothetical protein